MIVFLHGWLMSPEIWDPAIDALGPGHEFLTLRQPAHGSGPGPTTPWSMADWAEWAERRIDAAGRGPLVIVGHSMGGMLALALASRRPERVAGLVLVGTSAEAWPEEAAKGWLGMVGAVEAGWSPALAVQIAPMLMDQAFLQANPDWCAGWAERVGSWDRSGMVNFTHAVALRPDMTEAARQLGVRTLVVHGEVDAAVPFAAGSQLAELTGGELLAFPGVGHCPPAEAPVAFAEALRDFVHSL